MAILFVKISVGLISIVVILCVQAVEMNAHELITGFRPKPTNGYDQAPAGQSPASHPAAKPQRESQMTFRARPLSD